LVDGFESEETAVSAADEAGRSEGASMSRAEGLSFLRAEKHILECMYAPIEELVECFYFMRNANEREIKERRELTERIQRVEEFVDVGAVELDKGRDLLG